MSVRRQGLVVLAALAVSLGIPMRVHAQSAGLLPSYGTDDIRVGDLRSQFGRAFGENPKIAGDRTWTLSKSIGISETYDSNSITGGTRGKEYTTRITPAFDAEADTTNLKASVAYSPTLNIYARNPRNNDVTHNLNADVTGTVIEDLLFVDLRGYAATQPILSGFASPGSNGGRANEMQTADFSVSPYLQHRFGDTMTGRLAYTLNRTVSSSLAPRGTSGPTSPFLNGVNSNYTSQKQDLSLSSGPDFGRAEFGLQGSATQFYGAGLYRGAHTETITATTGYAVTRTITTTASIGHENMVYGAGAIRPITGMTWSGGLELTPNADSKLNLTYGHQQGGTSASVDGNYVATARITLNARYSQSVGTGLQNLQSAIASSTVGPAGIPIDRATGVPVNVNGYLGQQAGIYRSTIASIGGGLLYDRDVFALTLSNTDRQLLSNPASGGGAASNGVGSNSGINATATWQHTISDEFRTTGSLQYGTQKIPSIAANGSSETYMISLSANYQLSETVTTNALVSHADTKGPNFGLAPSRDTAVIGLNKAF